MIVTLVTYSQGNVSDVVNHLLSVLSDSKEIQEIVIMDHSKIPLTNLYSSQKTNYFHNPANPGFGVGHNNALSKAKSKGWKYWVCINPDIVLNQLTISDIFKELEFLSSNGYKGAFQPELYYESGKIQSSVRDFPGLKTMMIRVVKRLFNLSVVPKAKHLIANYKSYETMSGAFLIINKDILESVGLFDPRFFMYFEDLDLTYRISKKFFNIQLKTKAIHLEKRESHRSLKLMLIHLKSFIHFTRKWRKF